MQKLDEQLKEKEARTSAETGAFGIETSREGFQTEKTEL